MPHLSITTPDGQKTRVYVDKATQSLTVGRSSDCDIVIPDPAISSFHAELRRMVGGFCLVDCQSTTGIIVDGQRVEWAPLYNEQTILLGSSSLKTLFTDEEILFFQEETAAHTPAESLEAPAHPEAAYTEEPLSVTPTYEGEPAPQSLETAPEVAEQPLAYDPVTPPYEAYAAENTPQSEAPALAPAAPLRKPLSSPASPAGRAPLPGRGVPTPGQSAYTPPHSSEGWGMYLLLLAFICLGAIFAGMHLRYFQITGGILLSDWLNPPKIVEAAKPVTPPKRVEKPKPVVEVAPPKEEPAPPAEEEEDEPLPPNPMDTAIKEQGKYKLPTVQEFLIP